MISALFNVKNKSARNMLNKREPKNEPTVTPTTNYMSHLLVSFLSWLISSYGLVSWQVDQTFMCLALHTKFMVEAVKCHRMIG